MIYEWWTLIYGILKHIQHLVFNSHTHTHKHTIYLHGVTAMKKKKSFLVGYNIQSKIIFKPIPNAVTFSSITYLNK